MHWEANHCLSHSGTLLFLGNDLRETGVDRDTEFLGTSIGVESSALAEQSRDLFSILPEKILGVFSLLRVALSQEHRFHLNGTEPRPFLQFLDVEEIVSGSTAEVEPCLAHFSSANTLLHSFLDETTDGSDVHASSDHHDRQFHVLGRMKSDTAADPIAFLQIGQLVRDHANISSRATENVEGTDRMIGGKERLRGRDDLHEIARENGEIVSCPIGLSFGEFDLQMSNGRTRLAGGDDDLIR